MKSPDASATMCISGLPKAEHRRNGCNIRTPKMQARDPALPAYDELKMGIYKTQRSQRPFCRL
ncbi:hypothetical protein KCP77_15040 [Salmonella enterica subsp. enterica]|nr:hypothetical protein KCP77_15040 [Salmonella enterica subsp. enterica]